MTATTTIDADTLHAALLDPDELALIDTREEGVFGAAHILRAVNAPLSRLELDLRRLAPRREVRLVLTDDDPARLRSAAAFARSAGYTDVALFEGGSDAWRAAGYELFSGVNVPSKVFGEYVEHRYDTPRIKPAELQRMIDEGRDVVILDSRPFDEFTAMNIPGGLCCPGAELVYRGRDVAPDPETVVVVNCAGRTRSIIGCQSLVNAGLPNPVVALENGTMGWHMAGLELERGATRTAAPPSEQARAWAREAAARVARRFAVGKIGRAALQAWRADPARTTFVLDVRTPEEFAAGHIPGSMHAPGGQLVQATDRYVGVLKSRLVLVDDDEVRATMTASWLIQMGWPEVRVLAGGLGDLATETGHAPGEAPEADAIEIREIAPAELADAGDVVIVDLSGSVQYRKGHIPGAVWAIRSRLGTDLADRIAGRRIVVSSRDDRLSRLAAADLGRLGAADVAVLAGGHDAWRRAGLPLEEGMTDAASPVEDAYYRPYDRAGGVEQAMQAYLDWEIALIEQIERDRTLTFPEFSAA